MCTLIHSSLLSLLISLPWSLTPPKSMLTSNQKRYSWEVLILWLAFTATFVFVDKAPCFESSSLQESQHIFVDEMTDNDPSSCTELASIATRVAHIHVPINKKLVRMITVQGVELPCGPVAGLSAYTANICGDQLCRVHRCVALIAPSDSPNTSCIFRCSTSTRVEYIIVSVQLRSNSPSVCEIYDN